MAERITSSNLKAEILEAYNELRVEHKVLQEKAEDLEEENAQLEEEKEEAEERALPTGEGGAAPDSIEAVVEALSGLRGQFSGAINRLSAQLTDEVHTLEARSDEASAAARRLRRRHDLSLEEDPGALDRLIREYEETQAAQETERRERRRTLEREQAEREDAWEAEQDEHERAARRRDRKQELAEKREQEEYEYQLQQRRRREAAEHEQEVKRRRRELAEKVRRTEKEWAEREQAIAEREDSFDRLKRRVEGLPDEIEDAVETAREEAAEQVQRLAGREANLKRKDVEGELEVYRQRVEALETTLDKQTQHLERLDDQLDQTVQQAQDLAFRAIDSGSQAGTYEAVREIALEQAKGRKRGGTESDDS